MKKKFNVNGICIPNQHYMVDISNRLDEIKELVDDGEYFSINRGRQYGKTTTLSLLQEKLSKAYTVFFISFEGIEDEAYLSTNYFYQTIFQLLFDSINYEEVKNISKTAKELVTKIAINKSTSISSIEFSNMISKLCKENEKPIILIIDEADQCSNHKSFLDFLGVLRNKYLQRSKRPTFQSVILAGVYDIKNLKLKIRTQEEHQYNSPWNIAAKFTVDMSFSKEDITGMLTEYEKDHQTGMEITKIATLLYDYTSGYPYLVSELCKIVDEQLPKIEECHYFPIWSKNGILYAVKILLSEANTLFDDMRKKLTDFPELRNMLYEILYKGKRITFNIDNFSINIAKMFGFIKEEDGFVTIANRIFETRLYNLFVSEESLTSAIYSAGSADKNKFLTNNHLNMELVLSRFVEHFTDIYGDNSDRFLEEEGRKYFLFYLKPIINGVGNYYIEARTRNERRTDVIVDYLGEQFIIEMKIWHGNEYNTRGEYQLLDYLNSYHLEKGYMLSFNFNKRKEIGVKKQQRGRQDYAWPCVSFHFRSVNFFVRLCCFLRLGCRLLCFWRCINIRFRNEFFFYSSSSGVS